MTSGLVRTCNGFGNVMRDSRLVCFCILAGGHIEVMRFSTVGCFGKVIRDSRLFCFRAFSTAADGPIDVMRFPAIDCFGGNVFL